ncbi:MAG TPA: hypothetical protein VFZ63_02110 [Jiangellaceae bacterium]
MNIGIDVFQHGGDASSDWALLVRLMGVETEWPVFRECGADVLEGDGRGRSTQRPSAAGAAARDVDQANPPQWSQYAPDLYGMVGEARSDLG